MMMKNNLIVFFSTLVLLSGCIDKNEDSDSLVISNNKFSNLSKAATALTVQIQCSSAWSASSDSQWCIPQTSTGSGNATLVISISTNITGSSRQAVVTISNQITKKTILIQQLGTEIVIGNNQIPIIFHVLYTESNDKLQNVDGARLAQIIAQCNELYRDNINSINMGIQFVMAPTDANGRILPEAGIERIKWNEMPINIDDVMKTNGDKYKSLLWDPNKYINIFLYNFKSIDPKYITLGVSHLPFTTKTNPLAGLPEAKYDYIELSNLSYAHCLSINSKYINPTVIYSGNIATTVAHELGHYLGLHHVFSETDDGNSAGTCTDTDFCSDTKSYNRPAYEEKYSNRDPSDTKEMWTKRIDCNNVEFTSYNIMDYDVSYCNQFTPEQLARVQHVLANSPLIPRARKASKATKAPIGIIDLPFVVIE